MPSSSLPGFDLRSAVNGLRETFGASSSTTTATSPDAAEGRDIRAAVLLELSVAPMHGYQVIRAVEARTGGAWKPAPGSVYPTLQVLLDEQLVSAEQVDERRVYSLTDAGRRAAKESAAAQSATTESAASEPLQESQEAPGHTIQGALALTKAGARLAQVMAQVAQGGTPDQSERAVAIVDEARRKLYAILAER